jgi:hypothetical protein
MRCLVALLAIFFARAALAEEDMRARLFGSWRLISFQLKVVGEEGEAKDIFGPNPLGGSSFLPSIVSLFLYQGQTDDRRPASLKQRRSCPQ